AACLASGTTFLGLPVVRQRVLLVAAEDRAAVLRWRLRAIGQALGISDNALGDRLVLVDQSRRPAELLGRDRYGALGYTALFEDLATLARTHGAQVLLLDAASDTFGGSEIARVEVRRYITETQAIVPDDGVVGHLVHVDKAFARGGATAQAYSGSTAWHNSVRQRWELALPAPAFEDGTRTAPDVADPRRILRLAKNNYGAAGAELALTLDAELGCFTRDYTAPSTAASAHSEQGAVLAAIIEATDAGISVPAALTGPRTAQAVLSLRPGFPDVLRAGARGSAHRFRRHLEALRQLRYVDECTIRRKNRHPGAVLLPTSEGRANAPIVQ
ncbi:MAG: AAA family ATPase, partial [Burkholderiales bacterium]|nr:AAA family ATPase [Burkholderiales bacterium]